MEAHAKQNVERGLNELQSFVTDSVRSLKDCLITVNCPFLTSVKWDNMLA